MWQPDVMAWRRSPGTTLPRRLTDPRSPFHAARTEAVEELLGRSKAGHHTPYRWLARAISASTSVLVDVGCGTGPLGRELARPDLIVLGVDTSPGLLRRAEGRAVGPVMLADPLHLPLRDGSVDAVTSAMGLAWFRPVSALLMELARVLRPGGLLAVLVPGLPRLGPSLLHDLGYAWEVGWRLGAMPRLPGSLGLPLEPLLVAAGLRKVEDARQRYEFTIAQRADAELVVEAMGLPGSDAGRADQTVAHLVAKVQQEGPIRVPVPMRRIIAIK